MEAGIDRPDHRAGVVVEKGELAEGAGAVGGDDRGHAESAAQRIERHAAHAEQPAGQPRVADVEVDLKTLRQTAGVTEGQHLHAEGRLHCGEAAVGVADINAGDREVVRRVADDLDAALLGAVGEGEGVEEINAVLGVGHAG